MRKTIKNAIGGTIQDMVDSGMRVSFTQKELNSLGINIPDIQVTSDQIQVIRKQMNISQSVFARLLNVSSYSIRQWEQ